MECGTKSLWVVPCRNTKWITSYPYELLTDVEKKSFLMMRLSVYLEHHRNPGKRFVYSKPSLPPIDFHLTVLRRWLLCKAMVLMQFDFLVAGRRAFSSISLFCNYVFMLVLFSLGPSRGRGSRLLCWLSGFVSTFCGFTFCGFMFDYSSSWCRKRTAIFDCGTLLIYLSPAMRKPVFGDFDQVRQTGLFSFID